MDRFHRFLLCKVVKFDLSNAGDHKNASSSIHEWIIPAIVPSFDNANFALPAKAVHSAFSERDGKRIQDGQAYGI